MHQHSVQRVVGEEAAAWGDVLQVPAPDSYALLAIKSLALLAWTRRTLPQVPSGQPWNVVINIWLRCPL